MLDILRPFESERLSDLLYFILKSSSVKDVRFARAARLMLLILQLSKWLRARYQLSEDAYRKLALMLHRRCRIVFVIVNTKNTNITQHTQNTTYQKDQKESEMGERL